MRDIVRNGLAAHLDARVVDELLGAYEEAKREFYLGGHRLNAVEGGRFCEAAFRLLQQAALMSVTPLGTKLDTQRLIGQLESASGKSDSIRIHIPRALRVVYDIRNKRDAAHLGDGIDPNLQDATFVCAVLDWVLAEFVRLYHNVEPHEARAMVEELVTRAAPAVQDFDGFLKVLRPDLQASDYCLLLLYQREPEGATFADLHQWVRPEMRANLKRTLRGLEHDKALIHLDVMTVVYRITRLGQREVEEQGLLRFD